MKVRGRIGSGACGKGRCEIARWVRETQACGCKAHAGAGVGVGATRAGGGTCRLDVRRRCPPRTSRRKSTGRCGRGPSPSPSNQGRDAQTQLRFDAQRAYLVSIRARARGSDCKEGLQACIATELRGGVPQVDHEAVGRLSSSGLHARGPRPLAFAQEHALSTITEFSNSGGACHTRAARSWAWLDRDRASAAHAAEGHGSNNSPKRVACPHTFRP